jgi:tetratricopeptide (TPR) repeat protein
LIDQQLVQAVALHRQGQLRAAEALYQRILLVKPRHFDALHFSGVIAAQTGNPGKAVEIITRALEISPGDAMAHKNRGTALQELGRWEDAVADFDRAVALRNDCAEAFCYRGMCLVELRRLESALASYDQAIRIRPQYFEAHYNRGTVLCQLRRWEEAVMSFDRAIALDSGRAEAHSNRAFALEELGRVEEALMSCERAVAVDPAFANGHINRAGALMSLGRVDEGLASYDHAIAVCPDSASAHVNRGLARLSTGDFVRGWTDYEWRWQDRESWVILEKRNFPQRQWLGDVSPSGRTIFLQAEQGYGDTIQFCRYATVLAGLGARVILEVPAALASLAHSVAGVAQVVIQGETLPAFDYYCPLLSMPLAVKTRLDTIPAAVPYLAPSEQHRRRWAERLSGRARPRVGLVWSGGFRPNRPELWSANTRRNLPLRHLKALHLPGVEFFSLQKGQPAETELGAAMTGNWCGPAIEDLTHDIHDFADTAALIEQLDLVISVDTATAHLAGALAKPVWILNRFDACWRWLRNRSDSPWYPTARLYRQDSAGDWDGVIDRVRTDLIALTGS